MLPPAVSSVASSIADAITIISQYMCLLLLLSHLNAGVQIPRRSGYVDVHVREARAPQPHKLSGACGEAPLLCSPRNHAPHVTTVVLIFRTEDIVNYVHTCPLVIRRLDGYPAFLDDIES